MWKSWMHPDGEVVGQEYYQKVQWHDEFNIAPSPGVLGRAYLQEIPSQHPALRRPDAAVNRRR